MRESVKLHLADYLMRYSKALRDAYKSQQDDDSDKLRCDKRIAERISGHGETVACVCKKMRKMKALK